MLIKIHKNRSVSSAGTWGTKNENNYEILNFEFPKELEEYNKRIVYYLGNQKVWDAIIDNKAILTNAITTKGSVKAYIWCTKSDEAFETDVDFRTQIFVMNFFENDNADGIVPTEEQVDGFNTMLTAMNEKIEEIDELETTIENAETQRQENEETRQENENTRQENEQTRQEQEAERERRTDEAIGEIEDLTEEYNQNAQQKTEAFNNNATQKTDAFNSNAESKTSTFNTNATNKTNDFNSNASSKTTAFNNNATSKTNTFNSNADDKTSAFNNNATQKTTNFDNNASSKTTTFNENATSKTNDFNDNATQKTTDFNNNAQAKTEAFDEHTAEITADIEELQQEVEELSENMPWSTTEQATEISVDDAAKYSKNKLELFGNTEQAQYTGKNLIDYSARNKYNRDLSGAPSVGSPLRYYNNSKAIQFDVPVTALRGKNIYISFDFQYTNFRRFALDAKKNYIEVFANGGLIKDSYSYIAVIINSNIDIPTSTDIKFMAEEGSTATDYEPYVGGVPSPNPDYPQPIHVVTGNNSVGVQGRNLFDENILKQETNYNTYDSTTQLWTTNSGGSYGRSILYNTIGYSSRDINKLVPLTSAGTYTLKLYDFVNNTSYASALELVLFDNEGSKISQTTQSSNFIKFTIDNPCYMDLCRRNNSGTISFSKVMLVQGDYTKQTLPDYVPYYHADYPINLGSLELCKIGDYQDYIYKENGNWYKYGIISHNIAIGASAEQWTWTLRNENKAVVQSTHIGQCVDGRNFIAIFSNYYKGATGGTIFSASDNTVNIIGCAEQNRIRIAVSPNDFADIDDFKNFLQENNLDFYFVLATPTATQITDETLISQLEAIYNHLALVKGTNHITITPSDLEPYVTLNYMQDLKSKLDNLDSRLALLE